MDRAPCSLKRHRISMSFTQKFAVNPPNLPARLMSQRGEPRSFMYSSTEAVAATLGVQLSSFFFDYGKTRNLSHRYHSLEDCTTFVVDTIEMDSFSGMHVDVSFRGAEYKCTVPISLLSKPDGHLLIIKFKLPARCTSYSCGRMVSSPSVAQNIKHDYGDTLPTF